MLYAGPGNERWLVQEGRPPRGTGPDAAALVGALPSDAGFAFITPAGEVYSARSALGELSLTAAPSDPYIDAAAGRDHFLGIDAAGRLQRSRDWGQSWHAIGVPRHDGAFSDVAMLETGVGLLLATHAGKGQLFSTRDDGATWHKVDSVGRTFTSLRSYKDQLQPVVSVMRKGSYYVHATLDEQLSRVTGENRMLEVNTPFALSTNVPANVQTFLGARAASSGAAAPPLRWVALRERTWQASVWELSVTAFGELPSYRTIESLAGCAVSAAATASEIALACRHVASGKASLFLSDDDGRAFRELPLPPDPVALHALGDALVVQTPCDGPEQSRGPYLLVPPAWQPRRVRDALPLGERTCRTHLAFSNAAADGSFLSVAWANSELTLHRWRPGDPKPALVSTVGAATSEQTRAVTLAREGSTVVVALPTPLVWPPVADPDTLPKTVLFRSSDAGQNFSEVALPTAFRELVLFGRRGFGVGHSGQAWVTSDWGATWHEVSAPRDAGARPIECNDAGCLTARGLRVGWGL